MYYWQYETLMCKQELSHASFAMQPHYVCCVPIEWGNITAERSVIIENLSGITAGSPMVGTPIILVL